MQSCPVTSIIGKTRRSTCSGFLKCLGGGQLGLYVPAGMAVFLPRGVERAFVVTTETARVLVFMVPAGFEGCYREVGAAGGSSLEVERLVPTAAKYGYEITGPRPGQGHGISRLPSNSSSTKLPPL